MLRLYFLLALLFLSVSTPVVVAFRLPVTTTTASGRISIPGRLLMSSSSGSGKDDALVVLARKVVLASSSVNAAQDLAPLLADVRGRPIMLLLLAVVVVVFRIF